MKNFIFLALNLFCLSSVAMENVIPCDSHKVAESSTDETDKELLQHLEDTKILEQYDQGVSIGEEEDLFLKYAEADNVAIEVIEKYTQALANKNKKLLCLFNLFEKDAKINYPHNGNPIKQSEDFDDKNPFYIADTCQKILTDFFLTDVSLEEFFNCLMVSKQWYRTTLQAFPQILQKADLKSHSQYDAEKKALTKISVQVSLNCPDNIKSSMVVFHLLTGHTLKNLEGNYFNPSRPLNLYINAIVLRPVEMTFYEWLDKNWNKGDSTHNRSLAMILSGLVNFRYATILKRDYGENSRLLVAIKQIPRIYFWKPGPNKPPCQFHEGFQEIAHKLIDYIGWETYFKLELLEPCCQEKK